MKVYLTRFRCECGWSPMLVGNSAVIVACPNTECQHHGNQFEMPSLVLEPAETPRQPEPEPARPTHSDT